MLQAMCFLAMSFVLLTHSDTMTPFDWSGKEAFKKHCEKRRNCLYKQLLLFPQCFLVFLLYQRQEVLIFVTFNLSSANAFNLVWSKILLCGNGLNEYHTIQTINDPGILHRSFKTF